jgi:hypothetical protein
LRRYRKCLRSRSTLSPAVHPSFCHRTPKHCFILLLVTFVMSSCSTQYSDHFC